LERTDPAVKKASENLERVKREIVEAGRLWNAPPWAKRGPIDAILRLLQQDEITRAKALEMIRLRIDGKPPERCPWEHLNWCD
jgi:hypothetical protein